MEKNKYKLFVFLWVVSVSWVCAQTNRYMVFFSDKNNVSFSVSNPEAFLSPKAIERRQKINFPVTEQDLPVDGSYVQALEDAGAEVFFKSKWFNAALVQMDESVIGDISALTFVDSVNYIARGAKLLRTKVEVTVPDTFLDPERVSADTEFQLNLIGADEMHADGFRGEGMTIAVFDDGFVGVNKYKPFEHLFKENRMLGGVDFVKNSGNVFQYDDHGSASLSCIAADYKNVVGTAPRASYLLFVTEDFSSEYRIEEYNWLLAAEYADSSGVDIINSSLGYSTFSDPEMNYEYDDMNGKRAIVSRAARLAADRGIVVVVSAGNEGNKSWKYITAPADTRGILSVGSVNSAGERSTFSSVGYTADGRIKPEVMAFGSLATVFVSDGKNAAISTGSGTSFAAPQIAGFAAGIWQANPDWSGERLMVALKYSGSNAETPDPFIGYGIPSYNLAVQGTDLSAADILEDKVTVFPNPFEENRVQIDFGGLKLKNDLSISVLDLKGTQIYSNQISRRDLPDQLEINLSSSRKGVYYLVLESKKFKKTVKLIKI